MLSRRNFLIGVSAVAAATVAKAAIPLDAGSLIHETPAWMPEGFMLPEGQALSRLMYPDLFAAIGTAYGYGPTTFKLPDYGPQNAGNIKLILAAKPIPERHVPAGSLVDYFVPQASADIPSHREPPGASATPGMGVKM